MEVIANTPTYSFLQGGGEMGELIRNHKWAATPINTPDYWPQSLRTTVGNLINSAFPMFLFWGDSLICFYNDAFRPSLGTEGKHPSIGKKGKEVWPEIWSFIGPLIEGVMNTGKPVWFENQLVPFYRNGRIEDIYWTFSYSRVLDDNELPGGVLVTCVETTNTVIGRQEIEASQQELLALFEESPVSIANISAEDDLVFLYANSFYGELVGRKPSDLIGKPLLTALPELKDQGFDKLLKEVITTQKPFVANEVSVDIFRGNKMETVVVNFSYLPRIGSDGHPKGVLVVATDVTQQVNARKKIEESEQKYRSLFDSMNQGFCVLEMIFDENKVPVDYRFLEINPVFERQTGLKNAIGKTARDLVPNLEQHWFDLYGKVALTGQPERFTEGSEAMNRWFDVYAFRMGGEQSCKVALLFSDITERRKAENAIRKSEQNLRNIILQAPIAMCILRGENYIIDVANNKMFELWGVPSESAWNKPLFDVVPEAENEGFEELMTHVLQTGEPFTGREHIVSLPRDGKVEKIYIDFSYEAVRELDGTISGIMATVIDVTEQVFARKRIQDLVELRTKELSEANEALLRSNKELARSNANLEEFAHAASHDLKEPIRKINFFTQQLKQQLSTELKEAGLRSFNRIENAIERMGNLIDDLLLYSHVSQKPYETENVDLNQKIQRVLEDLELDIQEKKAIVHVGSLPVINGYRRQLQQVFQNLIGNALKYCKKDVPPVINIQSKPVRENGQPYHLISIEDNGIGFEQEFAEKIFQMFTRLHGRSEYVGTGVGLAIVKKVVENHNGFIRVESTPGKGSTFYVYMPAVPGKSL